MQARKAAAQRLDPHTRRVMEAIENDLQHHGLDSGDQQ
jgi:hypothetical protein